MSEYLVKEKEALLQENENLIEIVKSKTKSLYELSQVKRSLEYENNRLKKQLSIAVEALGFYEFPLQTAWHTNQDLEQARRSAGKIGVWAVARNALEQIQALEPDKDRGRTICQHGSTEPMLCKLCKEPKEDTDD